MPISFQMRLRNEYANMCLNMRPNIIAHRGDKEQFPENTLASFRSAIKKGADAIELDIHTTKDGKIIIHHDYYLGATNNGDGLIAHKDSKYIQSLDAGSWFSSDFYNEKIPFLEEVFAEFRRETKYEIELKGYSHAFLESVLELVKKYELVDNIEFTSPHPYALTCIKHLESKLKTGSFIQLYPSWMSSELGEAVVIGNIGFGNINVAHCPLGILSQEFTRILQGTGITVHAADCDTEESLQKAIELGVDQFSTSKLDLALKLCA